LKIFNNFFYQKSRKFQEKTLTILEDRRIKETSEKYLFLAVVQFDIHSFPLRILHFEKKTVGKLKVVVIK
jgi:hypothetical protein